MLSICPLTVMVLVTVTPSIFMLWTRLMSDSSAGNETDDCAGCQQILSRLTSLGLILSYLTMTTVQCCQVRPVLL